MKVLHLISGGDSGGAKSHLFTLLSALREEIDVKVICFMEGTFYREILKTEIPSLLLKQAHRYDMSVIGRLVKLIREERYGIIHAHGARANFIALFLRPFIKMPIVTTMHSDYKRDFTDSLYKKMFFTELNAVSLRFMDYFIAVSGNFASMLKERGFDPDKIYTVYNAIDFDQEISFCPREKFLQEHNIEAQGRTIVGIIGRLDKVKGHEVFIKAAAQVLKKRKDVIFLLAGDGPERRNLESLARSLGIRENIYFLGFIKQIESFINCIDINVLSSYSESFPFAILEGARHYKATVSTAVGGIPDLIRDGETGGLAPSADYVALGEKILLFIENPSKRKEVGEALYAYAKANFSKESIKKSHLEIYRSIISRQKQANRYFDVMLSGYYGFQNSGDDAILDSIIDSLKKEKEDISIVVLSKNYRETMEEQNVFAIHRYNFFHIGKYLKYTRLFVNGGGSLIQDSTSTRSLVYYISLVHWAKRLGLRVMYYANGIGPVTKKVNIPWARRALEAADCITLREPESFSALKELGVRNENVSLSSDPTLTLMPEGEERLDQIFEAEGLDKNGRYFVLAIRQWKHNDLNFESKMAEVIEEVSREYGLTPLFVPMQQPYDSLISREILAKLKTPGKLLTGVYSVTELLGIVGRSQFVLAMRLHALIYAVSIGVPIIGIIYDPKIKSFIDYLNQDNYVETNDLDVKKLLNMIRNIMEDMEAAKAAICREGQRLKELSNKDAKIVVRLAQD